jgi:hypothetical protein
MFINMEWEEYSLSGSVTAGFFYVITENIIDNPTVLMRLLFAAVGFLIWIIYGLIAEKLCKKSANHIK